MHTQPSEHIAGTILRVTGPLVQAGGMTGVKMYEVVKVSKERLLGEVIEISGDTASIQVYEETSGIGPGDTVVRTGETLSVELAPGLLESIYDGIQRPLKIIEEMSGSYVIARGLEAPGIDRSRRWEFVPAVSKGQRVEAGDVLGYVQETALIRHAIMVPPGLSGTVAEIHGGFRTVEEPIVLLEMPSGSVRSISMLQRWPIRIPRPSKGKIFPTEPLMTGIRAIDTFFPIAKGGAGSIPGPFGSGKTVTQQTIAKYCDAQVIVYIGCGERGNEMTEVLNEFPHLTDPSSGEPLMKRTVLIANTSNMPVAAREASIYTGVTIAEYYRDMGYSVAMMADSTSRWAEAMREISGRLEEMPGEEGYPAYLSSRTASLYERAGRVECLGGACRTGALTILGAVSPPGGDLSEPVSQATLRVTKTFWGLDAALAYRKHFPAINWLTSYSLYAEYFHDYWKERVGDDFADMRRRAMELLQKEAKLLEIVRLVGMESLSNGDALALETAKSIREDFLFQNSFDPDDAHTPLAKQYRMIRAIVRFYQEALPAVTQPGIDMRRIRETESYKHLPLLKTIPAGEPERFDAYIKGLEKEMRAFRQ